MPNFARRLRSSWVTYRPGKVIRPCTVLAFGFNVNVSMNSLVVINEGSTGPEFKGNLSSAYRGPREGQMRPETIANARQNVEKVLGSCSPFSRVRVRRAM